MNNVAEITQEQLNDLEDYATYIANLRGIPADILRAQVPSTAFRALNALTGRESSAEEGDEALEVRIVESFRSRAVKKNGYTTIVPLSKWLIKKDAERVAWSEAYGLRLPRPHHDEKAMEAVREDASNIRLTAVEASEAAEGGQYSSKPFEDAVAARVDAQGILQAAGLSDRQLEAFVKHEAYGFSTRELGIEMGVSHQMVSKYIAQARELIAAVV